MTVEADKLQTLEALLEQVKDLAQAYYDFTGRPLGVTGELGEYWAHKLLDVELDVVRSPGYDATDAAGRTVQIKTRQVQKSTNYLGETLGGFTVDKPWDAAMVVILKKRFEPLAIYEASRESVLNALAKPGSNARARGVLNVGEFRRIGQQVWPSQPLTIQAG